MARCAPAALADGRTWQDIQKLHDDWTGAVRDMIQTREGRVIFTTMKMLHDPGRHSILTYSSDDDSRTWRVFEYQPGTLWLTTMQGPVRAAFSERDFAGGE